MNTQFHLTRILSTDGLDQNGIQVLHDAGFEVVQQKYSKANLIKELVNFDAIIVRSATIIDREVIEAVTGQKQCRLKVIARAGTGVDNIDVSAATEKGILVINTPAANTMSAAEHTCALMCCLSRQIPQAHMSMQHGLWERKFFMGTELMGKTLAIIGLGKIGKEVALRAQAFQMTTIGYDPLIDGEEARKFNVRWMELSKIWPLADYITVHVPLIPQTENLINLNTFALCKKGVKIINCARGGIVSESDLLTALNEGSCGGAALDVFLEEPPSCMDLIRHPKLIATPHLGASTVEAQYRVSMEIAKNLVDLSTGSSIAGAVNGDSIKLESITIMQNWKTLLDRISNIFKDSSEVRLFYAHSVSYSTAFESFVKSYLAATILLARSDFSDSINLINASSVAKKKNLDISLQKINRQNSIDQPCFVVEIAGELVELSLLNGLLFLTGYGQSGLSQHVLLENHGHLIITTNSKEAFEMLADYIETNDLISFSAQDLSVFVFVVKKNKNHSFASIKLSIKF